MQISWPFFSTANHLELSIFLFFLRMREQRCWHFLNDFDFKILYLAKVLSAQWRSTRSFWPQNGGSAKTIHWFFFSFSFGPPVKKRAWKLSKWTQILRSFRESQRKHVLKILAVYFMWNPEIYQDPPICGQDELVHCRT